MLTCSIGYIVYDIRLIGKVATVINQFCAFYQKWVYNVIELALVKVNHSEHKISIPKNDNSWHIISNIPCNKTFGTSGNCEWNMRL